MKAVFLRNQMGRVFCKILSDGTRLYACKTCKQFIDESRFSRYKSRFNVRNSLRLQASCKKCMNEKSLVWAERNPDKVKLTNRKSNNSLEGRCRRMLKNAKLHAKARGLSFSLDKEWVLARLVYGVCEVTGIPFEIAHNWPRVTSVQSPWSPSIDRKDSQLGYTKDNCRVVVWMYNSCKAEFSDADVLRFAEAFVAAFRQ